MNVEALLAVADVIEYVNGGRFNLAEWACRAGERGEISRPHTITEVIPTLWDDCNTAGCIAGWTCAWADLTPTGEFTRDFVDSITMLAAAELGLSREEAEVLFVWQGFWRKHTGHNHLGDVTSDEAAAVIRRVAAGEISLDPFRNDRWA